MNGWSFPYFRMGSEKQKPLLADRDAIESKYLQQIEANHQEYEQQLTALRQKKSELANELAMMKQTHNALHGHAKCKEDERKALEMGAKWEHHYNRVNAEYSKLKRESEKEQMKQAESKHVQHQEDNRRLQEQQQTECGYNTLLEKYTNLQQQLSVANTNNAKYTQLMDELRSKQTSHEQQLREAHRQLAENSEHTQCEEAIDELKRDLARAQSAILEKQSDCDRLQEEKNAAVCKYDELHEKFTEISARSVISIRLQKVLVVIVCVGKYEHQRMRNLQLPGTQRDKQRLQQLFEQRYAYTVIANKTPSVKTKQMKSFLNRATAEFSDNEYDAVMVFYSGHGSEHHLLLSNYDPDKKSKGIYPRSEFEKCFNSDNLNDDEHDTVDSLKFYFIDSCRGENRSILYRSGSSDAGILHKGNENRADHGRDGWTHPDANKCIMYSNMNTYQSYEVPFDEKTDDVAWEQCRPGRKITDAAPKCGLFMNAVYKAYKENADNGYQLCFADIQDKIREFAVGAVPMLDAEGNTTEEYVGLAVDESGNLKNSVKRSIAFCK